MSRRNTFKLSSIALGMGAVFAFGYSASALADSTYTNYTNSGDLINAAGSTISVIDGGNGRFQNGSNFNNTTSSLTNLGTIKSDNWFTNGTAASFVTATITNSGTIDSANYFQNGASGNNDTSIVNNTGGIVSTNYFINGSSGNNDTSTFINNGSFSTTNYILNGSTGTNDTSTFTNNGTFTTTSWFQNGTSSDHSAKFENFGTLNVSSFRNDGLLVNHGTINGMITGLGTYQQDGGSITLGQPIATTNIEILNTNKVSILPGSLSLNSIYGHSYTLLMGSNITFQGLAAPSDTNIASYFNLAAFNGMNHFAPGTGITFKDTFAGGKLVDVAINFAAAVPEPEVWAMMLLGLPLIGVAVSRKQANSNLLAA